MKLFLILLFIISIGRGHCQEISRLDSPSCVLSRNDHYMLDTVEFQQEYTVLSFHTDGVPVDEMFVHPEVHLTDSKGEKYKLVGATGIQIGQITDLPLPGRKDFSLRFMPLPAGETAFDILDSFTWHFEKWGIRPKGNNGTSVKNETIKDNPCIGGWRADTVTIIGRLTNWNPNKGPRIISTSFQPIYTASNEIVYKTAWIKEDGSFTLRYYADRPCLSVLSGVGPTTPYYAVPGDTIRMEIECGKSNFTPATMQSSHLYNLHLPLLKALYRMPSYQKLIDDNRKIMAREELLSMLDSLEESWKRLNLYLSKKYELSPWERKLLDEHTALKFDYYRIHYAVLREHDENTVLFKNRPDGINIEDLPRPSYEKYDFLKGVCIDDTARYMTFDSFHIPFISQILSLNAFRYNSKDSVTGILNKLFPDQDCSMAARVAESMGNKRDMSGAYSDINAPSFIKQDKKRYVNLILVLNNDYCFERVKEIAKTEDRIKNNKKLKNVYVVNNEMVEMPMIKRLIKEYLTGKDVQIISDEDFAQIIGRLNIIEGSHVSFNKDGKLLKRAILCNNVENVEMELDNL